MISRSRTLLAAGLSLFVLLGVALFVPLPYVAMSPGETFDTLGELDGTPVIEIGGGQREYADDGQLRFTTVRVTSPDGELLLPEAVQAWFDPDSAVVPRTQVYPEGQSVQEAQQETALQMTDSQTDAEVAGLTAAGFDAPLQVVVSDVTAGGPSDGVLKTGDVVLAVDGTPVTTSKDATDVLDGVDPGDGVDVTFRRGGERRTATVTTADRDGGAVLEVSLASTYDFPFPVRTNVSDDIGGPSAGTMFALTMYDLLTPGSLTGGRVVAGTGTISADGTIGPIGGIGQKIAGAAEDGAEIFLVPKDNCEEALAGDDHGLRLIEGDTLDQAIDSLETLASDPDATVETCS